MLNIECVSAATIGLAKRTWVESLKGVIAVNKVFNALASGQTKCSRCLQLIRYESKC